MLAITKKEVVDYPGTAEPVLPVQEASTVQLRPGPAPTNLTILSSQKASLLGMQHHAASVGVIVMKPDYYGFMWWDGDQECRINGELARRTMIYAQGGQDGFHASGGARRTMGVAIRRDDLVETIAALRGVDPEESLLDRTSIELSPEAAARFRAGIGKLLGDVPGSGPGGRSSGRASDPGEAISGLLVDAYLHSLPQPEREVRGFRPEKLVRLAEERFFASAGAPVSLADLCAATSVSQATLYRAFHAVCGEPPLAYFHKRRLTHARRLLLRSPAYRGAVKSTAAACGLTELGRFAVEYRRLFGESPSATLNRTPPL